MRCDVSQGKDILAASRLTSCVDWKSISIILQQNFEKCFRAAAHNAEVTKQMMLSLMLCLSLLCEPNPPTLKAPQYQLGSLTWRDFSSSFVTCNRQQSATDEKSVTGDDEEDIHFNKRQKLGSPCTRERTSINSSSVTSWLDRPLTSVSVPLLSSTFKSILQITAMML